MDELIELLVEIVLEGSVELISNKKVPIWIRYPLIVFLTIFFLLVLFLILYCILIVLEENVFIGIIIFLIGLFIIIAGIKKVKSIHYSYKKELEEKEKNTDIPIKF